MIDYTKCIYFYFRFHSLFYFLFLSQLNIENVLKQMWHMMGLTRIYTKPRGQVGNSTTTQPTTTILHSQSILNGTSYVVSPTFSTRLQHTAEMQSHCNICPAGLICSPFGLIRLSMLSLSFAATRLDRASCPHSRPQGGHR
jgi:hypothetical protein